MSVFVKVYPQFNYAPEQWEKSPMFCPRCGKQDVWDEQSEGNYYVGPSSICIACECEFTIQLSTMPNESDKKRIEAIKKGSI